ncbi:hypothetical protein [Pseudomonas alloputida]|uniref:hypothetical protein n=1 Tax=Pseudomonas alloputida TaxID=1940621 RepID=UPI003A8570EC
MDDIKLIACEQLSTLKCLRQLLSDLRRVYLKAEPFHANHQRRGVYGSKSLCEGDIVIRIDWAAASKLLRYSKGGEQFFENVLDDCEGSCLSGDQVIVRVLGYAILQNLTLKSRQAHTPC